MNRLSYLLGYSDQHRISDELQEKLVTEQQRSFAISFFFVLLLEIGFMYWGVAIWLRLIVPLLWIGYLIHRASIQIIHELYEINDQLAGRKDELKSMLIMKRDDVEK